ncbi:PREDICTED: uncharacterized protein LOC108612242 [Drosophila arizonae]|uniref:Uncharacterized protein LOC108612242 n=1 Tax=Drosophila arizonae TaxID=7263 RepID=A0ABM1P071_DROAR|nr:PREDICTED: uncharacterized protein LOC108612242 [Drosophila arizonae]
MEKMKGFICRKAPSLLWCFRKIVLRRNQLLCLLLIFAFCYFLMRPVEVLDPEDYPFNDLDLEDFLVDTNHCKILDLEPDDPEVMCHFERVTYKPCKSYPPFTTTHYNATTQRYVLNINASDPTNSMSCCYMGVERVNEMNVSYTPCVKFKSGTQLPNTTESVIVKCRTEGAQVYINGHPTIPERSAVRRRLKHWAQKDRGKRVPSVLMIGIDSISRVNLIRAMPKTAQYLYENDWFELAGYNKVDDNTFPNLMALLVGYNLSTVMKHCNPYEINGLDQCDFIWKLFQKHGYVTAYGEDAVGINTFNYMKRGFQQSPVDYYMRPYLFAAEKLLEGSNVMGMPHCVGYATEAEHVYNYAQEFARRYHNDSFFGFFWTNTHSHSDISQTSSMDEYLRGYMQRLVAQGTMENSIVVFFSDHGLRFGPTRSTWSGHMEERLPFLFIWLPEFLRNGNPEFEESMRLNYNRLTTPYDLHMTLKHILSLTGRAGSLEDLGGAKDCPQCQSLLLPVPLSRSCEDVAIEDHWCTCWPYERVYKNSKVVQQMAEHVVQYLNDYVKSFRQGSLAHLCQPLTLLSMSEAYKAYLKDMYPSHIEIYRLIFYTNPNKALYEATVRFNDLLPDNESLTVTGSVSRLNEYNGEADCLEDFTIKKYCYCKNT